MADGCRQKFGRTLEDILTNDFSERCCWRDVAVTNCRHGDDGPPHGRRNAGERRFLLVLLDEVADRGENEDTHGQEQQQEPQLFVAVLQRVGDRLKNQQKCKIT